MTKCLREFICVLTMMLGALLLESSALAISPGVLKESFDRRISLTASYENASVNISFLDGNIIRFEVMSPEIDSSFPSFLTESDGAPAPLWIKNDAEGGKVSAGGLSVVYSGNGGGLTILSRTGDALLKMPLDGISWTASGSYSVSFIKVNGDRYFGLGEPPPDVLGSEITYDNRKLERPIWNRHLPPTDLGIPFFFNPRGYAIFADNPWKAEFDFSGGPSFKYNAEGGPFRFFVIVADNAFTALERYTALTGRAPIPPKWATGYMQSKYGYENEKDFRWLMDNFRGKKIPCDTLIFDLDWFGQGKMGDLWWNAQNFPDGPEFMKELESRGFKAITIVEPYIFMKSKNYTAALNRKLLSRTESGGQHTFPFWGGAPAGLMDFSNTDTQHWFADKISRIHDSGVDAWWTDLNEPENDFEETYYLLGHRNAVHNLQGFLMSKSIHDLYNKKYPDERLMIMSRSGFAGIQRFGAGVWSGDVQSSFKHLASQIPIGLSASLSGLSYWNSDTGGFHGDPSTELFVRWMQFSAFCPLFRAHGDHSDREPWSFGPDAEKILRNLIELRYRMAPYLYTLYHRAYLTGAPIMTPMFMEFPFDKESVMQTGQFMYGPALLVAPVVSQGAKVKKINLPPGVWTNYFDNTTVTGPKKITVPVSIETVPLFVREGAIIPLGPTMQFTDEKVVDPLTIHYYPSSKKSSFDLYEDDGATRAYERGEFAITSINAIAEKGANIKLNIGGRKGKYRGMPEKRGYEIILHGCGKPRTVRVNEKSINYNYDSVDRTITIEVPATQAGFIIETEY